jgi:hypothetical protein
MATKELLTRIALKYDTYANWSDTSKEGKGGNLVLLKGEIGLCEIPSGSSEATTAPTILFKVGNGEDPFKSLKWASATAADVHSWAKAQTVVLTGEKLQFKTGNSVVHEVDLGKFATDTELADAVSRIAAIEGSIGAGGSVASDIAALDARLDTIESTDATKAGSIAKAKADAIAAAASDATEKANTAESNAKTHANTEIAKDRERLTAIEGVNDTQGAAISANDAAIKKEASDRATAVSNEATARANADTAINEKIGGSYSKTATVHAAIVDAKKAGTDAQSQVTTLTNGAVKTNTDNIATNASNIAKNTQAIADEKAAREAADTALDERLDKIEVFFAGADADGEDKNALYDALDTLTEIQKYITDEGTAADEMVKDIAANANAITALQNIVKDGGTLEVRVDTAESNISAAQGKITALENVTKGYSGANAIKNAIDGVNGIAVAAQGAAGVAQEAAEAAQSDVDALELVVNNATTGLAAVGTKATNNASDISGLKTRMTTAEGDIDSLEAIVKTGDDANTKLRSAITSLQALTGDASKGNAKLRTDLTALTNKVDDSATGLAKTKEIADAAKSQSDTNKSDIATIKSDYLKAADVYIFNCGSATEVTHKN